MTKPELRAKLIAQYKSLPAWQVAELFGLPEEEIREQYGDPVRVSQDLLRLTVLPRSDEEG